MADLITRLKVDSQEYDSKLKRAADSLKAMEAEVRRTGASFAYASKEEVAYMQSLGSMATQATSAKGQLREFSNTIADLTTTYRAMTQEEKSSDFGRAMADSIAQLTQRAGEVKDAMMDVEQEIKNAASDTQAFDQIAGGVTLMTSTFQTAQGAAKLLGVDMGDNVEVLAKLQAAMAVTNGLTKIQSTLQKQSAVMMGVATVQKKAAAMAEKMDTAAKSGNIAVTKGATVAQAAFNAVANANPYVLLATAVIAVGSALYAFAKNADDAADSEGSLVDETKNMNETIGSAVGEVTAKFNIMREEWSKLSNDQEKNAWIEQNKSKLSQMGLAIGDINTADNVFIANSGKVIAALQARAKANALQELYQEKVKQAYSEAMNIGALTFSEGQEVDYKQLNEYKRWTDLKEGTDYWKSGIGQRKLTASGAAKLNKTYEQGTIAAQNRIINEAESKWSGLWLKAEEEAKALEESVNADLGGEVITGGAATGGGGGGGGGGDKKTLTLMQERQNKIDDIKAKMQELNGVIAKSKDEEAKAWATQELEKYQKELDRLNGVVKNTKGETVGTAQAIVGSMQEVDERIKNANDEIKKAVVGTEEWKIAQEALRDAQMEKADMTAFSNLFGLSAMNGLDIDFSRIYEGLTNGDNITDLQWQEIANAINEQLKALDIDPIKIDFETGNVSSVVQAGEAATDNAKSTGDAWQNAVAAVNNVGSALQQIEDPAAKVSGIVMQAVANIALGFAQATASQATGAAGVFGWIAAATAGLATMTATIASIKSVTSGYAEGGLILPNGSPYQGDNIVARLNAGEGVLTAQGIENAGRLASQSTLAGGNLQLTTILKGEDIAISLENNNRRRGRSATIRR